VSAAAGDNGDGPAAARMVILIHDVYELQNMSRDLNGSYELANDIESSDMWAWNNYTGFQPVGDGNEPFMGTLDGKGYTIRYVVINLEDRDNVGLFGETGAGSRISNLTMAGYNITGKTNIGGLVGKNRGTIENCGCADSQTPIASGSAPYSWLGGLVGWNDGELRDCFARDRGRQFGSVCGGLIGLNTGNVEDCIMTGNVSGGDITGGLVGNNSGLISGCLNTANVTGDDQAGGIAGQNGGGTIINCTNEGAVTGASSVGGIAGNLIGDIIGCTNSGSVQGGSNNCTGGIAAHNWKGLVSGCANIGSVTGAGETGGVVGANFGNMTKCYNAGNVTGTATVGGVAGRNDNDYGWMGVMEDCYNQGPVSGTREVGGLVGALAFHDLTLGPDYRTWGGNISRSYSAGAVTASSEAGGLVGTDSLGPAYDCYWDTQTSGQASSAAGTGKNTSDMMKRATFTNWDFDTVWDIIEGKSYPVLRDIGGISPPRVKITYPDARDTPVIAAWPYRSLEGEIARCLVEGIANDNAGNAMPAITRVEVRIGGNGTWTPAGFNRKSPNSYEWSYDWDIYNWSYAQQDKYPSGSIPCPISARAFNGVLWATDTVAITVILFPVNHDPVWASVPSNTTIDEGSDFRYAASATDEDCDTLIYGLTTDPACGMTINSSSGSMEWLNAPAGHYDCVVTVSDGHGAVSWPFLLSVRAGQAVQPKIVSVLGPENVTVKASSVQTFSVEAQSPTNATLTYEWKENNVTLSTEKSFSRKFSPGNHSLVLLIGDGHHVTTRTFNFTVARPPTTIEVKPPAIPGFEAGAAATALAVAAIALFWRRERRQEGTA
jgi:hypothetical protein